MKKWMIVSVAVLTALVVLVSCITVFANNNKKQNGCKEKNGYCQMESSQKDSCMKDRECSCCDGDCSKEDGECSKMQQDGCKKGNGCPRMNSSQMPGKKGKGKGQNGRNNKMSCFN